MWPSVTVCVGGNGGLCAVNFSVVATNGCGVILE